MKKGCCFIVFFTFCFTLTVLGQGVGNRQIKKRVKEGFLDKTFPNELVKEKFASEDAVILYEKRAWMVDDVQRTTLFTKHMRVALLTLDGAKRFARFGIPETVDPAADYADVPLKSRAEVHRPKFYDFEPVYFISRIKRADGTVCFVEPKMDKQAESLVFDGTKRKAHTYVYEFDLHPDDVLEVEYQYYLPYVLDWNRFFFHSDIAKQYTETIFEYPAREHVVWHYSTAVAQPADSLKTYDKPYEIKMTWQHKDLSACTKEPGAILHKDLPYVLYYFHDKIYGKWKNDWIDEYLPYGWSYYAYDLIGFGKYNLSKTKKFASSSELALNQYFTELKKQNKGALPPHLFFRFHTNFAEKFDYEPFEDHFANTDRRLAVLPTQLRLATLRKMNRKYPYYGVFQRLGDTPYHQLRTQAVHGITAARPERIAISLRRQKISNLSTSGIYEGLLVRIKEPFYIALVSDKRVAAINPDLCLPVLGKNKLYSLLYDKNVFYAYPKTRAFGYAFNEMPFYLEGEPSLHIAQMSSSYDSKDNVLFYTTPKSGDDENLRTATVMAKVNTGAKTVNFEAQLTLMGQFATLTRELYNYETIDSTINPLYARRLFDINAKTTHVLHKTGKNERQYPFKSKFRMTYITPGIVSKDASEPNYLLVDLSNWFGHIIWENFEARNRQLPFYPDFAGRDTYRYNLVFDVPVSLHPYKDLPLNIENEFGAYNFQMEQVNDTSILIVSDFSVKTERVLPENAHAVAEIYKAIQRANHAKLKVRLGGASVGEE